MQSYLKLLSKMERLKEGLEGRGREEGWMERGREGEREGKKEGGGRDEGVRKGEGVACSTYSVLQIIFKYTLFVLTAIVKLQYVAVYTTTI